MGLLKRQEPKCTCLLVAVAAAASTCLHALSVYATRAHAKCKYSQSERNSPFVHSFIKIKAIKVHLKRNTHISRGVHTFAYHGMGDQVRLGLLEMFTQPIKNGNQKCVEAKRLLHNRSSLERGRRITKPTQSRFVFECLNNGELPAAIRCRGKFSFTVDSLSPWINFEA